MRFEVDGNETVVRLETTPKGVGKVLVGAMVKVGLGLLSHLRQDHLSGQSLGVRTGTGRRSTFYRVEVGSDQDIAVVVGADLRKAKYMRAHDKGATLTPKSSPNLAIPIGAARTAKGVARFTAREVIANPGSFGYVGTFARRSIIFGVKDKGRIVPLFALKKRVVMKPVGFLAATQNERRAWTEAVISDAVKEELK